MSEPVGEGSTPIPTPPEVVPPGHKYCRWCGQVKPFSEYYEHSQNHYLSARCKGCYKDYNRKQYESRRHVLIQNQRAARARHRAIRTRHRYQALAGQIFELAGQLRNYIDNDAEDPTMNKAILALAEVCDYARN